MNLALYTLTGKPENRMVCSICFTRADRSPFSCPQCGRTSTPQSIIALPLPVCSAFEPTIERITVESGKRSGQPCVRGYRFTVGDLLSYRMSGMTDEEILLDFPFLSPVDLLSADLYLALA